MAWYWWVLIGIAAVGIGYIKLKILNKLMSKKDTVVEDNE